MVGRGEVLLAPPCLYVPQFQDLVAFRRAVSLAEDMHLAVRSWPSFERWALGMQLVRAADSVGANIAEAYGRWHRADQRRQLYVARGSAYETIYWTSRAKGLLPEDAVQRANEIARLVNALINAHKGAGNRA
jgi:four helix bundle protein